MELPPHFLHHLLCRLGDGLDQHTGEEEGDGRAHDGADDDIPADDIEHEPDAVLQEGIGRSV